ncbi:oxidoreductase [Devosia epidermidihirudinis]|uniref:Oxidoreductase n=1 Tax=Devosia epidermidihirudinis TaxID=1293439 RepID=A0A0F5Q9X9_9HYPH|nr:Gfo/Idh/MocA family oxidoreductase [Devosia epidermidihirudinis]KKC37765.1 oxidoreductase [Devosia epidermidihirudinis]
MSDIRNVAVIGMGIGRSHILDGYVSNGDKFRVIALCDLSPERMDAVGEEFGISRRVTSFEDVLAMDDVDVIDVCTPPNLHFPMVMAALKAGKHVVCEKPLVGSLAQVDAIVAQEKVSRGLLMPVFQYRFGDGIEQVKAIIDAGIAGRPFVGTVETFWRRDADYYAVPWRGKWASELGGVLMGHAIHPHDMFTYLMGDIARIFGRVATRVNPIEVEDTITASLEMKSGALASFTATLGDVGNMTRLRLAFENVSFESDHTPYSPGDKLWTIEPRNGETKARIDALLKDWVHVPPGYATQMARFHAALMGTGPLPITSADSRRSLELVTAFYHSSSTHKDVALPIAPDHPLYHSWVPPDFRSS